MKARIKVCVNALFKELMEARCTAGVVDFILLLLICHFNARHVFEKEMTHAEGSSCCTSAFPKLFVKMGHLRPCEHSLCILLR